MTPPRVLAVFLGLTAVGALSGCASAPTPDADYLRAFSQAEAAARPFPPITDTRPEMTLPEAYRLQTRLVARRVAAGDRVAGYRGSLMSKASMSARGVTSPLVGVLFRSGRADSGANVSLCGYRKASFEMKLAFVFRDTVRAVPADAEALSHAVAQVLPVVDLPDIAYRDPDKYSAVDMVAANISAARYVRGEPRATRDLDLNALKVSLTRDGQQVSTGYGRESLGDQWTSVFEVARQAQASGRTIASGDLVLTGRIGERGWLPPGDYVADYGPLGLVRFSVSACPAR